MVDEYAERLAEFKQRIAALDRKRVRAEHDRDAAIAQRDESLRALKAEFGVSTGAEIQLKLQTMSGELEDKYEALDRALKEAEGPSS